MWVERSKIAWIVYNVCYGGWGRVFNSGLRNGISFRFFVSKVVCRYLLFIIVLLQVYAEHCCWSKYVVCYTWSIYWKGHLYCFERNGGLVYYFFFGCIRCLGN